jgi:hypothetical protein
MLRLVLGTRIVDSLTQPRLHHDPARASLRFRFVFRQRGVAQELRVRDRYNDRHLQKKTAERLGATETPRFFGVVHSPCLASAGSQHELPHLAPSMRSELIRDRGWGRPGFHASVIRN